MVTGVEMGSDVAIRPLNADELRGWDCMVSRFPNHRVFHKAAWMRSIEAFTNAKPLYLVFERDGQLVGCLPGFLRRFGFIRVFGSPMEGWQTESMGPAFDPERLSTREMLGALVPCLEKGFGVHHIELMSSELDGGAMRELGFEGQSLFSYRATLCPGDEEAVLRQMKSNARNHLRKALKLGLVARLESDESFVAECYDQIKEVFTRRGAAVPFSEARVLECFRFMRDSGNLLAIAIRKPDDNECAATGIYLVDGRELILWCWTHRTKYRSYSPTELLTWTAMQKAMQLGCTVFDMTGGGDAKPKFGAYPYDRMYRWTRSRYRWLARSRQLAKRTYRWQQSLRGRLARGLGERGNGAGAPETANSEPEAIVRSDNSPTVFAHDRPGGTHV
jgi:CelD/BcsL family acetyltransferase involved in cellulose biosynthesis